MRIRVWKAYQPQSVRRAAITVAAIAAVWCPGNLRHAAMAQNTTNDKTDAAPSKLPVLASLVAEEQVDPTEPLRTGFVVNVSVKNEPEPSGNYTVNAAGNILLHVGELLSPVAVKGLAPEKAADGIANFLKAYIKSPEVTVSIVSVPRSVVFISGGVKRGGPVVIGRHTTLVELLSTVDWIDNADLDHVRIMRRDELTGKTSNMTVQVERYIQPDNNRTPDEAQNPTLQDQDSIFVPLKSLPASGVFTVIGEVTKPQQNIPLRTNPPLTVREAMAIAGGPTAFANHKAVTIRRANIAKPIVVDLDKAELGDPTSDIEIVPNDAIYVEKLPNAEFVDVNGAFLKPGRVPFGKQMTLTEAVMQAGGLAPLARDSEGVVLRHPDSDPQHTQFIPFRWKDILAHKKPDIELKASDAIWVAPGFPSTRSGFDPLSLLYPLSLVFSPVKR